jgi:type I restriction enzyme S subunit
MSFIVDNFPITTQTSDQILRLKALVLDLALRGNLVAQLESDEHVSHLLGRVTEERRQALGKKNKKGIQVKSTEQKKLFDLPAAWIWSTLGDVSINIHYGFTEKANENLRDVRFLRITDIQNNHVEWNTVPGVVIEEKDKNKYLLEKNDILIARTGGTIGKSYLVKDIPVQSVFASYLIRVIPAPSFHAEYIKLFLESPFYWKQLKDKTTGTGQPNVNATSLKALNIPIPPTEEQHRIVQKINTLFQQIDRLAESSDQAEHTRERLRRVLLHRLEQAPTQIETEKAWLPLQDQFDLAIRTVEDVQALRQTILQLAVKGQLVAQDPQDEHASVLLERIKAEKDRLVKEGKIRKQKKLPPISEEEVPFEVPDGWVWCRLNDICIILMGQSPKGSSYNSEGLGVPLINGPVEFGKGPFDKTILSKWTTEPTKMCIEGDLLVCVRGATTGRTNIAGFAACIGRGVAAIRPMIFERYLHFFMLHSRHRILDLGTGTTFPSISQDDLKNLLFQLPPLDEQQRIVEKVKQLLSWCDELEATVLQKREVEDRMVRAAVRIK